MVVVPYLSWSIFQPIKDNTVDSVEPVLALTHGIFHLYPILFPPFSFTSATLALPSSPRRLLHLFFLTHSYRSLIITITANFFFNSSRTTTWGRDSSITSIYHFSNRMRNSRFTRTSTRDDPSSWTWDDVFPKGTRFRDEDKERLNLGLRSRTQRRNCTLISSWWGRTPILPAGWRRIRELNFYYSIYFQEPGKETLSCTERERGRISPSLRWNRWSWRWLEWKWRENGFVERIFSSLYEEEGKRGS